MSMEFMFRFTPPTVEHRLILAISSLQGVLLYLLYRAVDKGHWPSDAPVALYTLSTSLIAMPAFFVLLLEANCVRRTLYCVAGYGVVMTGVGVYFGWQALPQDAVNSSELAPAYALTLAIASFKALIYAKQYVRSEPMHYPALLQNSWRLFLLGALSGLFVLLFWVVLWLWGALFDLIGIKIFSTVFGSRWFYFPASTTAFGFAVILFNNLDHIIGNLARLMLTMLRFLLPLLALMTVLFLVFLPFTGLQPIWDSRLGSTTLLWLVALLMFFANAVYQSGEEARLYSSPLHRLIALALASLPVYGLLALHGLFTRIAQYGLTAERCWGLIVSFLLLGFSGGYLWIIVRKRDLWLAGLQRINISISMGLVLIAVLIAVNTPLLNLQQWSVNSQLARLEAGLPLPSLDLSYFRRSLGKPGYEALNMLKARYATDAAFVARVERLYAKPSIAPQTEEELQMHLQTWPAQRALPATVLHSILESSMRVNAGFHEAYAVFSDLNNDGQDEIVTFVHAYNDYNSGHLWSLENGSWNQYEFHFSRRANAPELADAIRNGEIKVLAPRWQNLQIGDILIEPRERSQRPTEH